MDRKVAKVLIAACVHTFSVGSSKVVSSSSVLCFVWLSVSRCQPVVVVFHIASARIRVNLRPMIWCVLVRLFAGRYRCSTREASISGFFAAPRCYSYSR